MADTFAIDIVPVKDCTAGQPAAQFSPVPANVNIGNIVFFRNNDEKNAHWPVPATVPNVDPEKPDRTGWWMDSPIPTKLPDEPSTPSKEAFTPSVATAAAGVQYICALHPDEKGIIIVT